MAYLSGSSLFSSVQSNKTNNKEKFDLVFIDPPFGQNLLIKSCLLLEEQNWLADEAWLYIESEMDADLKNLPSNWSLHREKKAGQVCYRLFKREAL